MGANDNAPIDVETIRQACHSAMCDVAPRSDEDTQTLVEQLEGHVRLLAPQVAALVPDLDGSMRGAAIVTLRHVDEVLDPTAPRADRGARLHDVGVAARSLLELTQMAVRRKEQEQPGEPADGVGWLLVAPPKDPPRA